MTRPFFLLLAACAGAVRRSGLRFQAAQQKTGFCD